MIREVCKDVCVKRCGCHGRNGNVWVLGCKLHVSPFLIKGASRSVIAINKRACKAKFGDEVTKF